MYCIAGRVLRTVRVYEFCLSTGIRVRVFFPLRVRVFFSKFSNSTFKHQRDWEKWLKMMVVTLKFANSVIVVWVRLNFETKYANISTTLFVSFSKFHLEPWKCGQKFIWTLRWATLLQFSSQCNFLVQRILRRPPATRLVRPIIRPLRPPTVKLRPNTAPAAHRFGSKTTLNSRRVLVINNHCIYVRRL